jgi:hypothetical protein
MLAALPLGLLWRLATAPQRAPGAAMQRWPARLAAGALVVVAVAVTLAVLAPVGRRNFETYFGYQLRRADVWPDYSADATLVAHQLLRLGTDHEVRVAAALLEQPAIEFLVPAAVRGRAHPFQWPQDLPARSDVAAAYFFEGTKQGVYRWLERLYPEGSFHEYTAPSPRSPVVVYAAVIPAAAVHALRGLDAVYTPTTGQPLARREAGLDLDWTAAAPGPLPIDAVWSGFLNAHEHREYRLALEAPGDIRLVLDGEPVAEGRERIEVARTMHRGEHALRVEGRIDRPGRIRLSWDGEPVPDEVFFAYPLGGHGLLGAFFTNDRWEGEPAQVELTPLLGFSYHAELNIGPPLSIRWRGYLDVPKTGEYRFHLEANEAAFLSVDGQEILTTPAPNRGIEAPLSLTAGPHPIEVRLQNRGGFTHIYLSWTPPDGATEIIPPDRLSPHS